MGFEPTMSASHADALDQAWRRAQLPAEESNLEYSVQNAACCQLHQPGKMAWAHRPGGKTRTVKVLRAAHRDDSVTLLGGGQEGKHGTSHRSAAKVEFSV